jgi:hypothetical protein
MSYFDDKEKSSTFLSPTVNQYGSHMVMTNVSRETKKKYWNIDTQFRDDYQNLSGPAILTLPQPIPNVNSVSVVNAEIPVSFSNISASLGNNTIQITRVSNSAIFLLVLPDGWYNADLLKSKINAQLTTFDLSGLSYDISSNYSKFSVVSDAFILQFASVSTATTKGFDKYDVKSRLGWILGFRDISYRVNSGVSLFSSSAIDLWRPRYFYLVVDEFSGNTPNSFVSPLTTSVLNKNILAKITMDYSLHPFGTILPANLSNGYLQSDKRTYGGIVNLQRLRIQLVNEYGVAVDLNGQDFSFCLEIEYQ